MGSVLGHGPCSTGQTVKASSMTCHLRRHLRGRPTCVLRGVKADADRAQATGVPVRGQSVLGLPFAVTCRRLRVTWPWAKASH